MTRQILLKTPRGNTAVVTVDQFFFCMSNQRNKQDLLNLLIEASKKRDVGRKRSIRCLFPDDDDEEQELLMQSMMYCMDIEENNSSISLVRDEDRLDHAEDVDSVEDEDDASSGFLSTGSNLYPVDDEFMLDTTDCITFPSQPSSKRLKNAPPTRDSQASSSLSTFFNYRTPSPRGLMIAIYHQGRRLSIDRLWEWITWPASHQDSSCPPPPFPIYLTLSTSTRLLGGIDRQNRVGSKFGGGGVSSAQQSERERKERLRQLALESIDLAKDPYLMRNHLGTYECKLCLTLHPNEANYLAHTQGKKHQDGLARRAHMEKLRSEKERQQQMREDAGWKKPPGEQAAPQKIRIGRPAYQVFKSRDADTQQRCLSFELQYPQIESNLQPRHRFMSAFEQKIDLPPDRRYQYLLFAADPYQTVAFKIPNEPLDREPGRFVTYWDDEEKKFTLTLYFLDPHVDAEAVNRGESLNTISEVSRFAPAIGST